MIPVAREKRAVSKLKKMMCRPYAGREHGWRASLMFIIPQAAGCHPQVVLLDRTNIVVVHYATPDHKSAILRKKQSRLQSTRRESAHTVFHSGRGHRSRPPLPSDHGGRESKPRRRSPKIRRSSVCVLEPSGRLCAGLVQSRGQGALPPASRDGTCPRGRQRQRRGSERSGAGGGHCHMRESR